jgi:OPT family oligopeptide transporter
VGIIPALQSMTEEDHPGGGLQFSSLQLIVWSLGVAFFGVFFAIPLRTQTIIREKLRFPSGTATAQMISILHQRQDPTERKVQLRLVNGNQLRHRSGPHQEDRPLLSDLPINRSYSPPAPSPPVDINEESDEEFEAKWALKWRALLASFSLSSAYTVTTYFFPIAYALPVFNWLSFGLIDFKAWDWYFTPSLSYVGQGIIMGLPTTLSMLLGCVVGWGILSPLAHFAGWAPGPVDDWKDGSKGWILWISLGVMIAESFVSLTVVFIRSTIKSFRDTKSSKQQQRVQIATGNETETAEAEIVSELDESAGLYSNEEEEEEDAPPDQLVSPIVTVIGLVFSTLLCLAGVAYVFGTDLLPLHMTFIAVVLAMILSVLGVRALGETDLNPVSGLGKISQVCFAAMMPGGIVANLVAGGIAEAGAQQAGDLMQGKLDIFFPRERILERALTDGIVFFFLFFFFFAWLDLKTGHLLRASPKAQFYGQMIGSFFSVFVSTGTCVHRCTAKLFPH